MSNYDEQRLDALWEKLAVIWNDADHDPENEMVVTVTATGRTTRLSKKEAQ